MGFLIKFCCTLFLFIPLAIVFIPLALLSGLMKYLHKVLSAVIVFWEE